jgi:hypothetical protein
MENVDLNKRFWVFGTEQYYPLGGLDDIIGTFDAINFGIKMLTDFSIHSKDRIVIFDVEDRCIKFDVEETDYYTRERNINDIESKFIL